MDLLAFLTGLVTGLAFVGLLLQRLHAARARVNAARALARDAQTELVVVRERTAAELDAALHAAVSRWLAEAWPFAAVDYADRG